MLHGSKEIKKKKTLFPYRTPGIFLMFHFIYLLILGCTVAMHGLSLIEASRGYSQIALHELPNAGSVLVTHRISWISACGIVPDQGWNPCPLYQQADT